jgi:hypothetical protein
MDKVRKPSNSVSYLVSHINAFNSVFSRSEPLLEYSLTTGFKFYLEKEYTNICLHAFCVCVVLFRYRSPVGLFPVHCVAMKVSFVQSNLIYYLIIISSLYECIIGKRNIGAMFIHRRALIFYLRNYWSDSNKIWYWYSSVHCTLLKETEK